MDVVLRPYDLVIKTTEQGEEYVAFNSGLGFNKSFIASCRNSGVENFVPYKRVEKVDEVE